MTDAFTDTGIRTIAIHRSVLARTGNPAAALYCTVAAVRFALIIGLLDRTPNHGGLR